MSEDASKSTSLSSITDLLGIAAQSKSFIEAIQAGIGRAYKPIAMRKEGNVLIDLQTRAIIEVAKARVEAETILRSSASTPLERVRAIEGIELIGRLENQAEILTDGVDRAAKKDPSGEQARPAATMWMDLFLEMAGRINDDDIRRIWSEILAREVTQGQRRMSLYTLDSMRYLEARHARLFDAYARTFVAFGRCWRDGFDTTFGSPGESLLGRSDNHNDFRALAEMGFVEIHHGDTPSMGVPSVLNFYRFGVRITPTNKTFNINDVKPTMRGEELMRVMLGLDGDAENIKLGRFAANTKLMYDILDADRQAMVLRRWFQHLHAGNFEIQVGLFGPNENFLNCSYHLAWSDRGLYPIMLMSDSPQPFVPPEISKLLA